MTSRSVGYEQVAKNLAVKFTHYRINFFEKEDIARLSIGWHKIFYGESKEIIAEAEKLSDVVTNNERIFELAKTPVLLTTLLLVKRWVGCLPTRRAELYGETIKVLLYTWGADVRRDTLLNLGEDALPQLAYLAYHMMFHGKPRQTIGKTELKNVLMETRKDLSQFFTTASETDVNLFIERVEGRSELLVMRGYHSLDDNTDDIEGMYEFSHLTIQEYLAAFAIKEKYYHGATQESRISNCFKDALEEKDLREVILLTSVLTDRWGAEDIANLLLDRLQDIRAHRHIDRTNRISYIINLLMQMIADIS